MMERRELFKIITAGALAGSAVAQTHHHGHVASAARRPPFFTPAEQAVLDRLADIIIPSDEQSPGAHDAGVVRYLDILAAVSGPQRQQQWRLGLDALEAMTRARFARPFSECARVEQEEMVGLMALHEGRPQTDGERFFELLKAAVIDGYRYSEIGVKQYMGWVGNRFDVKSWAGACTHPEHGA